MSEEGQLSVKWEGIQGYMILCWDVNIYRKREWATMPIVSQTEKSLEESIWCLEDEVI